MAVLPALPLRGGVGFTRWKDASDYRARAKNRRPSSASELQTQIEIFGKMARRNLDG